MKGNFTYRLNYEKGENARYISHLDFVRVLNRTIRRSNLAVTYTEGFNPHPVMVVAMPISVGVTSSNEYIDIDFDENPGEEIVFERFKNAFPEGILLKSAKLKGKEFPSFKDLDEASYICEIETDKVSEIDLDGFLNQSEIIVSKKTKSSVKDVDIKNDIKSLALLESGKNYFKFSVRVPAGNNYNLKPELVFNALAAYQKFELIFVKVHRTNLYAMGKEFV